MGLPNRTTFMQQHKQALLDRYRVCSDGVIYRNDLSVRNWTANAPLIPKAHTKSGKVVNTSTGRAGSYVAYNALRWLLATRLLPNGAPVLETPSGLMCGDRMIEWRDMLAPPVKATVAEPPRLSDMAWLAKETPKQLCDLYEELLAEASRRNLNLQTRTIITEVSV